MDDRRPGRLEPIPPDQLVLLAVAIVLLAVLVGSASRPGDLGPAAPPDSAETGAAVIRAIVILLVIAEMVVVGLVVWALWPGGHGRRRVQAGKGTMALAIASFLQTAAALLLFWLYLHFHLRLGSEEGGLFAGLALRSFLPQATDRGGTLAAGQWWLTVTIVVAVVALAAAQLLRGTVRRRTRRSARQGLAEQLQEALEEGLEELESEADPRRAVIGAYAGMERSLARAGAARRGSETALEYLERMLRLLDRHGPAATRLTSLFQVAKFSAHPVDEGMKRDAIAALIELRDDLRAAASAADPDPVQA
jgi:hypothetical protein